MGRLFVFWPQAAIRVAGANPLTGVKTKEVWGLKSGGVIGAISLNGQVDKEACEGCIWYHWDKERDTCRNRSQLICALYLNEIFKDLSPRYGGGS